MRFAGFLYLEDLSKHALIHNKCVIQEELKG